MHRQPAGTRKKLWLIASLSLNLGLLGYFKYANFFVDNANAILGIMGNDPFPWTKVVLPIGISFFTFESLTYVIDVYRGVHKPLDNFGKYLLYIILFPKLIAGPIIRYHEISTQLDDRPDTAQDKLSGLYRFAIGLGKKAILANSMAAFADPVFSSDPESISTSTAWLGALAYTMQIYFDFSGYSDMAIGIGRILGFRFPENFDQPYAAGSITEFWRRWHMTLGNWMKHYLYIPLGGSQVTTRWRMYFNLWIVFLASGFWHGASWSFIFWGAYHGIFLVLERAFLKTWLDRLPRVFAATYTMLIVSIGWVYFELDNFGKASAYLMTMAGLHGTPDLHIPGNRFWAMLILALGFSWISLIPASKPLIQQVFTGPQTKAGHIRLAIASILLFVLGWSYVTASDFNPFIYFRF